MSEISALSPGRKLDMLGIKIVERESLLFEAEVILGVRIIEADEANLTGQERDNYLALATASVNYLTKELLALRRMRDAI